MKACFTSSGIWPGSIFSRVAGPSFWITAPLLASSVIVPGRVKRLMPRASGKVASTARTTADCARATPLPMTTAEPPISNQ